MNTLRHKLVIKVAAYFTEVVGFGGVELLFSAWWWKGRGCWMLSGSARTDRPCQESGRGAVGMGNRVEERGSLSAVDTGVEGRPALPSRWRNLCIRA